MDIRIEKIDSDRAKALLATTSGRNRRYQVPHAQKLARDMTAGAWHSNSVIQIDAEGNLRDGQHRMQAVVISGTPQEFIVVYGIDAADQTAIDVGRKRTLSDTFVMAGERNADKLAAAVSWLWRRERSLWISNQSPTITEGVQVLSDNPNLRHSIAHVRHPCIVLRIPTGLGCCLHYQMSQIDSEAADDFWRKLDSGLDIHERHPIYALRQRLANNLTSTGKLDATMIHALIIKTWNAYLRGEEYTQVRWRRGGPQPEAFPEMEALVQ
jgi:hypothetical protein